MSGVINFTYKDFINMGFVRIDRNDDVFFNKCGYNPFELKFVINTRRSILINSSDLKRGKLIVLKKETWLEDEIYNLDHSRIEGLINEYKEMHFK